MNAIRSDSSVDIPSTSLLMPLASSEFPFRAQAALARLPVRRYNQSGNSCLAHDVVTQVKRIVVRTSHPGG